MRRFEEQYRLNEGDDVLNRENAIHQDVDLRLDAVEQDAEAFRAGNRADIEAILKSLEQTFGTLAAEMRGLLDQTVGGLSADIIVETTARYFLTDARRAAILSDLRGGVDASGDTLAKLLALIVGVVGGAPAGRQSLKAINDAVVSNTTALNAILTGADPLIDTFAEIAAKFTSQGSTLTEVLAAIGNRLRLDAAGSYALPAQLQGRQNLGVRGAGVLAKSAAYTVTAADAGKMIACSGSFALTLPSAAAVGNGFAVEVANVSGGKITLTPSGSDTIRGQASYVVYMREGGVVVSDGANWQIAGFAAVVVASSFADPSSYIRWSNGWTKQWGISSGDNFVAFPLTFSARPSVNATTLGTRTDGNWIFSVMITRIDTASFDGRVRYAYGSPSTIAAGGEQWLWSAEGWI